MFFLQYKLLSSLYKNKVLCKYSVLIHMIKIVPAIVLIIDVFYFKNIKNFYISLYLLIILLIYRYIEYSLNILYILDLEQIEKILDIRIQETENDKNFEYKAKIGAAHYLIQEVTLERLGLRKDISTFHILLNKDFVQQNSNKDPEKIFHYYYYIKLKQYSQYYEVLYEFTILKQKYDPYINLISLILFTISWFYITYTSHLIFTESFVSFWIKLSNFIS